MAAELANQALDEIRRVSAGELGLLRVPALADDLLTDLQLDSVGLLTLVVALEDRFRVRLPEEAAGRVRTVGDLVELVAERAQGGLQ